MSRPKHFVKAITYFFCYEEVYGISYSYLVCLACSENKLDALITENGEWIFIDCPV